MSLTPEMILLYYSSMYLRLEMLKEAIVQNELGGFTAEKCAVVVAGSRMEIFSFSKFVLARVSIFIVFC